MPWHWMDISMYRKSHTCSMPKRKMPIYSRDQHAIYGIRPLHFLSANQISSVCMCFQPSRQCCSCGKRVFNFTDEYFVLILLGSDGSFNWFWELLYSRSYPRDQDMNQALGYWPKSHAYSLAHKQGLHLWLGEKGIWNGRELWRDMGEAAGASHSNVRAVQKTSARGT
jgi:hypothetical protein